MPGAGIMVNFTAVEPPLNVNRFSNANHSDVFSWMVTDSRGKTQTFPTFDFKDHPNLDSPKWTQIDRIPSPSCSTCKIAHKQCATPLISVLVW